MPKRKRSVIIESEEEVSTEKFDILGNLPKEICYKIMLYLTPEDVAKSFQCCKKWQQQINYNFIWKTIYQSMYSDYEEEPVTEGYQKTIQSCSVYWQARYMYKQALKSNIESRNYRELGIKVNKEEKHECIHFDDRYVILGIQKSKLLIINSVTGMVERAIVFKDYVEAVRHGEELIAITEAGRLNIWNIADGKCVADKTLPAIRDSEYSIRLLLAYQHLIIIGKLDHQVYLYDRQKDVTIHNPGKLTICCTVDALAMVTYQGTIDVKDSDLNTTTSLSCAEALTIVKTRMYQDFLVKQFVDLQRKHLLTIWNMQTKENFNIAISLDNVIHKCEFYITPHNTLLCRTDFTICEMWNMHTQNLLFRINVRQYVTDIIFHGPYIYANSIPFYWQVWCIKTGAYVTLLDLSIENSDLIATTNSKVLCTYSFGDKEYWDILDYESNMLKT